MAKEPIDNGVNVLAVILLLLNMLLHELCPLQMLWQEGLQFIFKIGIVDRYFNVLPAKEDEDNDKEKGPSPMAL